MRDFVPVAPVNYSDLVLVVHPSVAANSLAELIALAKAKPGVLNYASSGPGTPYHMAGELFKAMAGTRHRARAVQGELRRAHRCPRRAGADDVRRHHHHGEHVRAGKLSALAPPANRVAGAARGADDVRSRRARLRSGDLARHHGAEGDAARIVARLNAEIARIVAEPEVRDEMGEAGRRRR